MEGAKRSGIGSLWTASGYCLPVQGIRGQAGNEQRNARSLRPSGLRQGTAEDGGGDAASPKEDDYG